MYQVELTGRPDQMIRTLIMSLLEIPVKRFMITLTYNVLALYSCQILTWRGGELPRSLMYHLPNLEFVRKSLIYRFFSH
jgi:hypothetical protein